MSPILDVRPLGFPWQTVDPFLFCVHHDDRYPAGNEAMGPAASLAGRDLGMDFAGKDGWRMYHGRTVPGFPQHPHRGFETITIARHGRIDHADSLGATARFGSGDVQWMTAGKGIVHAEMFPLLEQNDDNRLELFQIWINLPAEDKLVDPHFRMLWSEQLPRLQPEAGVDVTVYAGALDGVSPPSPPPHSWASRADANVAIWGIKLAPGARWTLPPAPEDVARTLYFFVGDTVRIADRSFDQSRGVLVRPESAVEVEAGGSEVELLMLQGRPIAEPVAQHGPFVMNTRQEIQQAFRDYRRTGFGGWPWPDDAPVHPREAKRFARHADGRHEEAPT
ncbi:MAG: pirin family protein [Sandaracinaceae bacterium]